MITYVDTSSLLKLVVEEVGSSQVSLIWDSADVLATVTLITVECHAALAGAARAGRLNPAQHRAAKGNLADLFAQLSQIEVTDALLAQASELAEADGLRAYDAVHLAAALLVRSTIFSSADKALNDAAAHHGLHVVNPLESQ